MAVGTGHPIAAVVGGEGDAHYVRNADVAVVVVVPAAEAGEIVEARKPAIMASAATMAVPGTACRLCRSCCL
jgi:hypothetical protein